MERLIEIVRQHPCLWDISSKEYRNAAKKNAAWETVIDYLNWDDIKNVNEAKAEWKKLRDNHRDSLKRNKPSGINPWKYAEAMEFLVPYMKSRDGYIVPCSGTQSPQNIDVKIEDFCTYEDSGEILANLIKNEPSEETIDINLHTTSRKRKLSTEMAQTHTERQEERHAGLELKNTQPEEDAIDLFLESMGKTIKMMPPWMQRKCKSRILSVVSEAEDKLDTTVSNAANQSKSVNGTFWYE